MKEYFEENHLSLGFAFYFLDKKGLLHIVSEGFWESLELPGHDEVGIDFFKGIITPDSYVLFNKALSIAGVSNVELNVLSFDRRLSFKLIISAKTQERLEDNGLAKFMSYGTLRVILPVELEEKITASDNDKHSSDMVWELSHVFRPIILKVESYLHDLELSFANVIEIDTKQQHLLSEISSGLSDLDAHLKSLVEKKDLGKYESQSAALNLTRPVDKEADSIYNRIFLIDDDPIFLALNKGIIEKSILKGSLYSYRSGKELLEYLIKNQEESSNNLVFLDLNMPGMSGWDVLDLLKFNIGNKKINVVILSSSTMSEDVERASKYSIVIDYIQKPLTTEKIERLMAKSVLMARLEGKQKGAC
ncbi:MAG: hypothetical protein DA405_12185 [Bacteroidetes bacterium]|nr:MAG: hypothetical protein DA405_12185 [Bacteroidota bacterium]